MRLGLMKELVTLEGNTKNFKTKLVELHVPPTTQIIGTTKVCIAKNDPHAEYQS